MTRTNLSLAEIARLWRAEKPLYLAAVVAGKPRRLPIRGIKFPDAGGLRVKVSRDGKNTKWENADHANVVLAY